MTLKPTRFAQVPWVADDSARCFALPFCAATPRRHWKVTAKDDLLMLQSLRDRGDTARFCRKKTEVITVILYRNLGWL